MKNNFKTVPNQKVVTTVKQNPKVNFMQISNDAWQQACKELTPGAFKVYLYFMSNANGYTFALSPADIEENLGVSNSTYKRAVKELEEKNYLVQQGGNTYQAFETPNGSIKMTPPERSVKMTPPVVSKCTDQQYQNDTTSGVKMNGEIDKKINKDKIDSYPSSGKEGVEKQLREKGLTEEHIAAMFAGKPESTWEKNGYGLMFTAGYQNQHKPKAAREITAEEIEILNRQKENKVVEITTRIEKTVPKTSTKVDVSAL